MQIEPTTGDMDMADRLADGPKYPEIEVDLIGTDGNAFAILAKVQKALKQAADREAHVSGDDAKTFMDEAISGDYEHLLRTVDEWVTVR